MSKPQKQDGIVYSRNDGKILWIRYRDRNGKRCRESVGTEDWQEANRKLRERLQEVFRTRTRDEWCALLEGTDACFAGILDMDECVEHPHNRARRTHVDFDGVLNPAPAPRFSVTPSELRKAPSAPGEDTESVLGEVLALTRPEIERLRRTGALS